MNAIYYISMNYEGAMNYKAAIYEIIHHIYIYIYKTTKTKTKINHDQQLHYIKIQREREIPAQRQNGSCELREMVIWEMRVWKRWSGRKLRDEGENEGLNIKWKEDMLEGSFETFKMTYFIGPNTCSHRSWTDMICSCHAYHVGLGLTWTHVTSSALDRRDKFNNLPRRPWHLAEVVNIFCCSVPAILYVLLNKEIHIYIYIYMNWSIYDLMRFTFPYETMD